jgi:hypothetical protein
VLCGPFTGTASNAMVVTFTAPTCWGVQGWAVYRYVGSAWQLVTVQRGVFIFRLDAVGSAVRETAPVFRPGDSRCDPSGGSHARLWRWDGGRLVAGAWRQTAAPRTQTVLHVHYFESPSHNIYCGLGDEDRAYCRTWDPPQSVSMDVDGKLQVCTGSRQCTGPCGPLTHSVACSTGAHTILGYGQRDEYAAYRCTSATTGVTCIVMRSGASKGKGFRIARAGITRVGP